MADLLSPKEIIEVFTRFKAHNPNPKSELVWSSPFTLLVAVVLSAQATDKSVNEATPALFAVADTPEKILALGEEGLIPYIKSIGLYRSKARHIIGLCRKLLDDFGGTTLLVTHSRDVVHRLCRTVTILNAGRASGAVPVSTLFRTPRTLAACLLSGCKNYSRAFPRGEDMLYAEDWGVSLRCSASPPDALRYVAIRAHHLEIAEEPGENVIRCRVSRVVRDVFSTIAIGKPLLSDQEDFQAVAEAATETVPGTA